MQFDINGRLQLNGEALSASAKKLTSGLGAAMETAGADAGAKLDRALDPGLRAVERKIESTFKRALQVTPDAGILDLDLPGMRAAAAAMEQQAQKARDLAAAKEAVNRASGVVTRAQQTEIAAAQNVAMKYERQAQAAMEEVRALELLQAELGQTADAQQRVSTASNAQKAGMQQVGFQLQDFAVQVAGGTSAVRAFSQQAPQMFGAFALMADHSDKASGRFSSLMRLLGGPFGIALGVAIPVVAMLGEKLLGAGSAAQDAERDTYNFSNSLVAARGLVGDYTTAIDALTNATKGLINTQALMLDNTRTYAQTSAKQLQAELAKVDAEIGKVQARRNPVLEMFWKSTDDAILPSLLRRRQTLQTQYNQAQGAVNAAQVAFEERQAREAANPDTRARAEIERDRARLLERRKFTLDNNGVPLADSGIETISQADFDRELQALEKREQALQKNADTTDKAAAASARAAAASQRLSERGEDAAKRIANITDRFADMPTELQQSQRALRELNDLANDFAANKPPNYEQLIKQIDEAKELIRSAPGRRLQKELDEELKHMEEAARLEAIRAKEGEHAAEAAAEYLRIIRQFPTANTAQLAPFREIIDKRRFEAELKDLSDTINVDVNLRRGKSEEQLQELAAEFEDLFGNGVDAIWQRFEATGLRAIAKTAAELAMGRWDSLSEKSKETLREISGNAGVGAAAARMSGGSSLGGAFGGAIGGELGKSLAKPVTDAIGGTIGKTLGSIAGPLGSIAGGLLGGLVGGLFGKSTPMGSTVVSGVAQNPVVAGTRDAGVVDSLTGMSKGLQQNIQRIADQLGAEVGQFAVSFGQRGSYYRVAGTATSAVGNKHPHKTPGIQLLYDGQDPETAMRLAVLNALQDGAIKGVREGTQRLLKSADDLETGLTKALTFEQAFKDLKRYTDPVGAALDEVNLKFKQLVAIAKEAGATDDEMRQLEELYKLQREEAVSAAGVASEALKDFLQSLKAGSNSPLSLREQQANARAALDPFIADITAGKNVDTTAFQQAAQTFLQIERDINGSTKAYFAQYDMITRLTEQAIAAIDNQNANTGDDEGNPFEKAIAQNSEATANILEQQSAMLAEQTRLLQEIAAGRTSLDAWYAAQRGY